MKYKAKKGKVPKMGKQEIVVAKSKEEAKKLLPWARVIVQVHEWTDGDKTYKCFAVPRDFTEWTKDKRNALAMVRFEASYE